MKLLIKISFPLFIFLLCSSHFAQKKERIDVSPNLTAKTILKKCDELDLGKVISSPKPDYPEEAKLSRVGGTVKVDIKVDEKGNVSEILNVEGHKLLQDAAVQVAKKATFTPTICDGKLAQINAVMIYNFIPFVISDTYFTPSSIEDYSDVSTDSKYYESILLLTENYKLTFGYGDKKFHSDVPLTKGDFAHFLRLTLDLLQKRAMFANKIPKKIDLYFAYNPEKIKTIDEIKDLNKKSPYSDSLELLLTKYNIGLIDESKKFNGKLPLTQNEVIDYWTNIFGKDAVPVNFQKIKVGDKILTRGEFSLFLQESLYVLTYKVLP